MNGERGGTENRVAVASIAAFLAIVCFSCVSGGRTSGSLSWDEESFGRPGLPGFELQAFPQTGDTTGIDVQINAALESLVYVTSGTGFEAILLVDIELLSSGDERLEFEESWAETLRTQTYGETRVRKLRSFAKLMPARPGSYVVRVRLTDQNTKKSLTRARNVVVPSFDSVHSAISEIHVRVRNPEGEYAPFLGLHVPGPSPDLRCGFRIHNAREDVTVRLRFTVLRIESDSLLPAPPYALTPTRGSLRYEGIDHSHADTAFSGARMVRGSDSRHEILWDFSLPARGVYLMAAEGDVEEGSGERSPIGEATRPIVVVSSGFPRPVTIEDLLEACTYILNEAEDDSVSHLKTAEEKRKWFENFWIGVGGNEAAAQNLIKQYYSRVEEANQHFSSFREGWRTDRGMVYIVMGPPESVQRGPQAEVWNYSPNEGEKTSSFLFQRVSLPEELDALDHYVLERQPYYDQSWLAAADRWRRGSGY